MFLGSKADATGMLVDLNCVKSFNYYDLRWLTSEYCTMIFRKRLQTEIIKFLTVEISDASLTPPNAGHMLGNSVRCAGPIGHVSFGAN